MPAAADTSVLKRMPRCQYLRLNGLVERKSGARTGTEGARIGADFALNGCSWDVPGRATGAGSAGSDGVASNRLLR
jgi:hypothetical protein